MTAHKMEKVCSYDIKEIYNVIIDVESYPLFLSWCSDLKVVGEDEDGVIADMIVNFKHLIQHYRSKIISSPPKNGKAEVKTHLVKGPFKYINSCWQLEKVKDGTKIIFFIDFQFKSILLEKMIGMFFGAVCQKMIQEFEQRTLELANARAKR